MKIKIFSTEIYVSFLFFAVISIMLVTDRTGLVIPTLFAAMIHETGHLFAMWVMDCAPKSIRLIPASIQIVRAFSPKPYGEVTIAILGPLSNIVLFFVLGINYLCFKNEVALEFAALNLILGIFNFLPVKGLDGGTILYSLICRYADEYRAEKSIKILTVILAAASFFGGVVLALHGKLNISAFIIALYLIVMVFIKK